VVSAIESRVLSTCVISNFAVIKDVLLSTHANRQSVDISVTVSLFFLCVCVCTVMDFSGEVKASSVKFCTVVHWHFGQGISYFGELCSPRSAKLDE